MTGAVNLAVPAELLGRRQPSVRRGRQRVGKHAGAGDLRGLGAHLSVAMRQS